VVRVLHRHVPPPVYIVDSAARIPPVPLRGLPVVRNFAVPPHSTPAVEGVGVERNLVVADIAAVIHCMFLALGRTVAVVRN